MRQCRHVKKLIEQMLRELDWYEKQNKGLQLQGVLNFQLRLDFL